MDIQQFQKRSEWLASQMKWHKSQSSFYEQALNKHCKSNFHSMVAVSVRRHASTISDLVTANNALLARLKSRNG